MSARATFDLARIVAIFSPSGKTICGFINEDKPSPDPPLAVFREGIMGAR